MNQFRLTKIAIVSLFVVPLVFVPAQADPDNLGFELGDLTGWTVTLAPGGGGGTADVVMSDNTGFGIVNPQEGNWFAKLKTDGPGSFTSLEMVMNLAAGDEVTGYVRWFDNELAGQQDNEFDDTVEVNFIDSSLVEFQVFEDSHAGNTEILQDWEQWSFIAPATDTYTMQLQIKNVSDDIFDSIAYFDNIVVPSKAPEPGSALLLAFGLLGGGAVRFVRNRIT